MVQTCPSTCATRTHSIVLPSFHHEAGYRVQFHRTQIPSQSNPHMGNNFERSNMQLFLVSYPLVHLILTVMRTAMALLICALLATVFAPPP